MTLGNGVIENGTYNSRLQTTSYQLQPNGGASASSTYQYYADGNLRFSHSLDNRFDRAFAYDQAERMTEAYSGSEARDFMNNTNSGTPTGPYRQSYQYTAFDQISQETNRLWSQSATTTNSFVNNRRQGWSYDAAGFVINADNSNYIRDAAGRTVQFGVSGAYNANKYDGDGRLVGISTVYGATVLTYYLNSSVLGVAVATMGGTGQRQQRNVYAGDRKLATENLSGVLWINTDPVTGSRALSDTSGWFFGSDAEFNADGVDVGLEPPTAENQGIPDTVYPKLGWSSGCSVGTPSCQTCYLDGSPHDCGQVGHLISLDLARQCPDNDCGPRYDPNRDGLGRGGWKLLFLLPGGFSYEPLGPSSRPRGMQPPTLKTVTAAEAALQRSIVGAFGRSGWGDEGYEPQNPGLTQDLSQIETLLQKPTCAEFLNRVLNELGNATGRGRPGVGFADLFHAIPTSAFLVNPDMKGAIAHAAVDVGDASFTITIKEPNDYFAPYYLMHEIIHGAPGAGHDYTHYEMAKAAWEVGSSMGVIYKMENFGLKDVTPNPNQDLANSREEKQKINNTNSMLFNAILTRACRDAK